MTNLNLGQLNRAQYQKWGRMWMDYSTTSLPCCPPSQKAILLYCPVIRIHLNDPISSTNFWKWMHKTTKWLWCKGWGVSTPSTNQLTNQPTNQSGDWPMDHVNLVRVKICHLGHRLYWSPSCSVMVIGVQNIIFRSIIINQSINSLQVGTHTCP
jgi:hypothetical protein